MEDVTKPPARRIWKFPIKPVEPTPGDQTQYIECQAIVPAGSLLLKVSVQDDIIQSWWSCDPDWEEQRVETFAIVPTGGDIPDLVGIAASYWDTVFMGPYVWHVYRLDPGF